MFQASVPKKWLIAAGVILLLILLVAVPYHRMMTDDFAGRYRPVPSEQMLHQAAAAAVSGQPATLSEEDINSFSAYHLEEIQSYFEKNESTFVPNQLILHFKEEDMVAAYTPVTWRGKSLGITSESRVEYDAQRQVLTIQVQRVKLGRLGISPAFALDRIFAKGLPQDVTREGSLVTVDISPLLQTEQAKQVGFELLELKAQQGGVRFQAKSKVQEYGSQIKEKVKDWLGGDWAGELGQAAETLQEYLKKSGIDLNIP